jgi:hypothetical protein
MWLLSPAAVPTPAVACASVPLWLAGFACWAQLHVEVALHASAVAASFFSSPSLTPLCCCRYCNVCIAASGSGRRLSKPKPPTCELCRRTGGAMLACDVKNSWVHNLCASVMPETSIVRASAAATSVVAVAVAAASLAALTSAIALPSSWLAQANGFVSGVAACLQDKDRLTMTCVVCKQKGSGACIQCRNLSCHVAFHAVRPVICVALFLCVFDRSSLHAASLWLLCMHACMTALCSPAPTTVPGRPGECTSLVSPPVLCQSSVPSLSLN